MNRFYYFESLYFKLLIFLFVQCNKLQIFEVKGYTIELKITITPLYYIKNYKKHERKIAKNHSLLKVQFS